MDQNERSQGGCGQSGEQAADEEWGKNSGYVLSHNRADQI
jgi:hypothetical protein